MPLGGVQEPIRTFSARPVLAFSVGSLWRVTSITGMESHVFGTLHIGRDSQLAIPDEVWPLLDAARRVLVEVIVNQADEPHIRALQKMPAGADWSRSLNARQRAQLLQRLAVVGHFDTAPGRTRPWVLVNAMLLGPDLPAQSLDDMIIARARAAGLPVAPLETVMEQFASLDCIDTKEQLHLLRDALRTPAAEFRALTRETIELYAQQRLADLVALQTARFPRSQAARQADAQLTRCAIDERTERFLARLDTLLQEPGQFVAVGAAHLVGPAGLLARLHQRGFRVERVLAAESAAGP